MFEKFGIVTNVWAERMDQGDLFIDLAQQFGQNGFSQFEVRDGDYLCESPFGNLLEQLKVAMTTYSTEQWKQICQTVWQPTGKKLTLVAEHQKLFQLFEDFTARMLPFQLSYAISHSWLSQPSDFVADNDFIQKAKRLSCLLCPQSPRLRLVDLTPSVSIDFEVAKNNINRYTSLAPQTILAVENAVQPATDLLELVEQTQAVLTYDEANSYRSDGSVKDDLADFWQRILMQDLTSVHFKQKTADGVLTELKDGWVDFKTILRHLKRGNYQGDLLLENMPSGDPLTDAINSRRYLLDFFD